METHAGALRTAQTAARAMSKTGLSPAIITTATATVTLAGRYAVGGMAGLHGRAGHAMRTSQAVHGRRTAEALAPEPQTAQSWRTEPLCQKATTEENTSQPLRNMGGMGVVGLVAGCLGGVRGSSTHRLALHRGGPATTRLSSLHQSLFKQNHFPFNNNNNSNNMPLVLSMNGPISALYHSSPRRNGTLETGHHVHDQSQHHNMLDPHLLPRRRQTSESSGSSVTPSSESSTSSSSSNRYHQRNDSRRTSVKSRNRTKFTGTSSGKELEVREQVRQTSNDSSIKRSLLSPLDSSSAHSTYLRRTRSFRHWIRKRMDEKHPKLAMAMYYSGKGPLIQLNPSSPNYIKRSSISLQWARFMGHKGLGLGKARRTPWTKMKNHNFISKRKTLAFITNVRSVDGCGSSWFKDPNKDKEILLLRRGSPLRLAYTLDPKSKTFQNFVQQVHSTPSNDFMILPFPMYYDQPYYYDQAPAQPMDTMPPPPPMDSGYDNQGSPWGDNDYGSGSDSGSGSDFGGGYDSFRSLALAHNGCIQSGFRPTMNNFGSWNNPFSKKIQELHDNFHNWHDQMHIDRAKILQNQRLRDRPSVGDNVKSNRKDDVIHMAPTSENPNDMTIEISDRQISDIIRNYMGKNPAEVINIRTPGKFGTKLQLSMKIDNVSRLNNKGEPIRQFVAKRGDIRAKIVAKRNASRMARLSASSQSTPKSHKISTTDEDHKLVLNNLLAKYPHLKDILRQELYSKGNQRVANNARGYVSYGKDGMSRDDKKKEVDVFAAIMTKRGIDWVKDFNRLAYLTEGGKQQSSHFQKHAQWWKFNPHSYYSFHNSNHRSYSNNGNNGSKKCNHGHRHDEKCSHTAYYYSFLHKLKSLFTSARRTAQKQNMFAYARTRRYYAMFNRFMHKVCHGRSYSRMSVMNYRQAERTSKAFFKWYNPYSRYQASKIRRIKFYGILAMLIITTMSKKVDCIIHGFEEAYTCLKENLIKLMEMKVVTGRGVWDPFQGARIDCEDLPEPTAIEKFSPKATETSNSLLLNGPRLEEHYSQLKFRDDILRRANLKSSQDHVVKVLMDNSSKENSLPSETTEDRFGKIVASSLDKIPQHVRESSEVFVRDVWDQVQSDSNLNFRVWYQLVSSSLSKLFNDVVYDTFYIMTPMNYLTGKRVPTKTHIEEVKERVAQPAPVSLTSELTAMVSTLTSLVNLVLFYPAGSPALDTGATTNINVDGRREFHSSNPSQLSKLGYRGFGFNSNQNRNPSSFNGASNQDTSSGFNPNGQSGSDFGGTGFTMNDGSGQQGQHTCQNGCQNSGEGGGWWSYKLNEDDQMSNFDFGYGYNPDDDNNDREKELFKENKTNKNKHLSFHQKLFGDCKEPKAPDEIIIQIGETFQDFVRSRYATSCFKYSTNSSPSNVTFTVGCHECSIVLLPKECMHHAKNIRLRNSCMTRMARMARTCPSKINALVPPELTCQSDSFASKFMAKLQAHKHHIIWWSAMCAVKCYMIGLPFVGWATLVGLMTRFSCVIICEISNKDIEEREEKERKIQRWKRRLRRAKLQAEGINMEDTDDNTDDENKYEDNDSILSSSDDDDSFDELLDSDLETDMMGLRDSKGCSRSFIDMGPRSGSGYIGSPKEKLLTQACITNKGKCGLTHLKEYLFDAFNVVGRTIRMIPNEHDSMGTQVRVTGNGVSMERQTSGTSSSTSATMVYGSGNEMRANKELVVRSRTPLRVRKAFDFFLNLFPFLDKHPFTGRLRLQPTIMNAVRYNSVKGYCKKMFRYFQSLTGQSYNDEGSGSGNVVDVEYSELVQQWRSKMLPSTDKRYREVAVIVTRLLSVQLHTTANKSNSDNDRNERSSVNQRRHRKRDSPRLSRSNSASSMDTIEEGKAGTVKQATPMQPKKCGFKNLYARIVGGSRRPLPTGASSTTSSNRSPSRTKNSKKPRKGKVMPIYTGLEKFSDEEDIDRRLKLLFDDATRIARTTTGADKIDWQLHVVNDDSETNAFVTKSGKIFVFTGLIKLCEECVSTKRDKNCPTSNFMDVTVEDALAAVISHELVHVLSGHTQERFMVRAFLTNFIEGILNTARAALAGLFVTLGGLSFAAIYSLSSRFNYDIPLMVMVPMVGIVSGYASFLLESSTSSVVSSSQSYHQQRARNNNGTGTASSSSTKSSSSSSPSSSSSSDSNTDVNSQPAYQPVDHIHAHDDINNVTQRLELGLGGSLISRYAQHLTMKLSRLIIAHGRICEWEADIIGVYLMARAQFNPRGARLLWTYLSILTDPQTCAVNPAASTVAPASGSSSAGSDEETPEAPKLTGKKRLNKLSLSNNDNNSFPERGRSNNELSSPELNMLELKYSGQTSEEDERRQQMSAARMKWTHGSKPPPSSQIASYQSESRKFKMAVSTNERGRDTTPMSSSSPASSPYSSYFHGYSSGDDLIRDVMLTGNSSSGGSASVIYQSSANNSWPSSSSSGEEESDAIYDENNMMMMAQQQQQQVDHDDDHPSHTLRARVVIVHEPLALQVYNSTIMKQRRQERQLQRQQKLELQQQQQLQSQQKQKQ